MSSLIKPGDPILFMKVGTHANEPLEEIIERKQREIADAGYGMWGYGGNTCHPSSVQPFARDRFAQGHVIRLCMQPMTSRHFAAKVRAQEYSTDRFNWQPVPQGINVLGSRFALCIRTLEAVEFTLDLDDTRVAVGRNSGRAGTDYIKGRVDKACLDVVERSGTGQPIEIGLVAELQEPFAVYLRNPEGQLSE